MQSACCYYLSLLLFIGNLFDTIATTIEHRCENDLLQIQCGKAEEKIQIIRSMYGRTSQRICQAEMRLWKTCANIDQSKRQLKERCHGQSSCQLRLNNEIFTDPCGSNIPKHFEIHYRCINPDELCPSLLFNCSKTKDLSCLSQLREDYFCSCPSTVCQLNSSNEPIAFHPLTCRAEVFHGIQWLTTPVLKGQSVLCPSPCSTGQITRLCQENQQWAEPDYTSCQCPIDDQFNLQTALKDYRFQCSVSWLIRRVTSDRCLLTFFDLMGKMDPSRCLAQAYHSMSWSSCPSPSFSIQFQNLTLQINQRMLLIENRTDASIHVIGEKQLNSMENLTLTFPQSSNNRSDCRVKDHRLFRCQLICQNSTHLICQCPYRAPSMVYVLHPKDDEVGEGEEEEEEGVDPGRCHDTVHVAKKMFTYLNRLIEKGEDEEHSLFWFIEQFDSLTVQLMEKIKRFSSIHSHIEYFLNYPHLNSSNRTIDVQIEPERARSSVTLLFNVSQTMPKNVLSPLIHVKTDRTDLQRILLHFPHRSSDRLICVSLNRSASIEQWITDGCTLIVSNWTHSTCSCDHQGTFALTHLIEERSNPTKMSIGSLISILSLLIIIIRSTLSLHHEHRLIRTIVHLNFFLCSMLVQTVFLVGLHSVSSPFICRYVSYLLHYFLLASFSWTFVDALELLITLKYSRKIDRMRLWAYGIYAYGFPLLIVLLSISLSNRIDGQTSPWICLYPDDDNLLWTFAIPYLLLIVSQLTFFLLSYFYSSFNAHLNSSLRHLSCFTFILSSIWFCNQFVFIEDRTTFLFRLITLINTFQGLFISIFYFFTSAAHHPPSSSDEKTPHQDNASHSDYSSAPSSESNRQILHLTITRSSPPTEYLPSFTQHLSTFRSSTSFPLTDDEHQSPLDLHQYYEIR